MTVKVPEYAAVKLTPEVRAECANYWADKLVRSAEARDLHATLLAAEVGAAKAARLLGWSKGRLQGSIERHWLREDAT